MKIKKEILPLLSAVVIVIGIMLFGGATAFAATDEATGLEYTVTDDEATITGFTAPAGFDGKLNIPDALGGASVTGIGDGAFYECGNLLTITMPDSVSYIGSGAFYHCNNLLKVSIPDSIMSIGESAFTICINLTSITLPDSITSINDNVFYGCFKLTNITIPDSVISIGNNAFRDCSKLGDIIIPDSVTNIGNRAFYNSGLTSISIPNSVTSIGNEAFAYTGLTHIAIPDSITSIGTDTFFSCGNLTSIIIPNSVTDIGEGAFSTCTRLTNITIPDSVTNIGDFAFSKCSGLRSITIPNTVTSLGQGTFFGCTSLASITLPDNITDIRVGTFSDCTSLSSLIIPDSVTSIGNDAFAYCRNLMSIIIPDKVTRIGADAFRSCRSLSSIIIPDSITSIGSNAFIWCTSLLIITIPDSVTYIGNDAFLNCSADLTIYGYPGSYAQTFARNNGIIFFTFPTINPFMVDFDKNPANQEDVSTTITWNDASSVADVKKGGISIGTEAYSVTGSALAFNTTDSALTIKKEYLATQATGTLALTVEFDRGTPATLTINISDTTQEPSGPPPGGGGLPSVAPPAVNPAPAADKLSPSVSVDRTSGTAAASINGDELNKAFDAAKTGSDGVKTIKIEIPEVAGVNSYVLQLPSSALTSASADRQIELKSAAAGITLPGNMLQGTGFTASGNVGISIGKADVSKLPQAVQDSIGVRPVVELKLTQGNKTIEWNNPNVPVTVSVPYVPTAEELKNPEHIVIWYIDGSGNAIPVPSGRYNATTGAVVFTATHFSRYAVAYVAGTFGDLGSAAWAKSQIEVLASKGIMRGTSEKEFTPQAKITRADFMYSLIRALGADAEIDVNFDDIATDAYYYREIGIAKKLGITSGTGNNRFSPDSAITRQDMMALTDKALKLVKKLKLQGLASELEKFTDRSLIGSYAADSIASIVKEGLIVGNGGRINPLGSTTRAEVAVFLYKIYYKY